MTAAPRHLILVKHAPPIVEPGVSPARWVLSDAGRARCAPLADRLRAYRPALIAAKRGRKVADILGRREPAEAAAKAE